MPATSLLRRTTAAATRGRRHAADAGGHPLEQALLRQSVGRQEAHRDRCVHCHRTPLTGEMVYLYAAAGSERLVCELCRPLRREAPARSQLVHAPEHERSVRITRAAA
jgi:hypothetical protein